MLQWHNDGKGKWQSHEVSHGGFPEVETAYGETYEEAYQNFKKNLDAKMDEYHRLYANIDKEIPVQIDCLGKPIGGK